MLSEEFKPVTDLFFWQLLGDFVRVLSVVIAYQFIAKNMFWHYIITETFSVLVLYFSSIYLIDIYGIEGANMAHFVNYILYFIVILIVLECISLDSPSICIKNPPELRFSISIFWARK